MGLAASGKRNFKQKTDNAAYIDLDHAEWTVAKAFCAREGRTFLCSFMGSGPLRILSDNGGHTPHRTTYIPSSAKQIYSFIMRRSRTSVKSKKMMGITDVFVLLRKRYVELSDWQVISR